MAIKEETWVFPKIGSKKQRVWYTPESVSHPAKMNTLLTRHLINTFTRPGDVVLDPMAGVGTTLIEGMLLGRNVVGVDIEDKFCKLVEGNIKNVERINSKSRFKLCLGKAQVICGDSRNLAQLLQDKMDAVVTSPPYGHDSVVHKGRSGETPVAKEKFGYSDFYSSSPENIGNLKHSDKEKVDAVVTSPPYSGSVSKHAGGDKVRERFEGFMGASQIEARKYSEDERNIGNLPHGKDVDVVITSPPFANIAKSREGGISPHMQGLISQLSGIPVSEFAHDPERLKEAVKIAQSKIPFKYSDNPSNIGNLRRGESVDAIVTSPPYEGSVNATNDPERRAERMQRAGLDPKTIGGKARCGEIDWQYSEDPGTEWEWTKEVEVTPDNMNVQEQKADEKGRTETYLEAMLKVYREMYKVLKPGGLAIIVLKNFIRNWKVVDLIGDTVRLCEFCGFKLVKRIRFVLPTESFWRTNYRIQYMKRFKKPFPEKEFETVYRFETCLVFEKV